MLPPSLPVANPLRAGLAAVTAGIAEALAFLFSSQNSPLTERLTHLLVPDLLELDI